MIYARTRYVCVFYASLVFFRAPKLCISPLCFAGDFVFCSKLELFPPSYTRRLYWYWLCVFLNTVRRRRCSSARPPAAACRRVLPNSHHQHHCLLGRKTCFSQNNKTQVCARLRRVCARTALPSFFATHKHKPPASILRHHQR